MRRKDCSLQLETNKRQFSLPYFLFCRIKRKYEESKPYGEVFAQTDGNWDKQGVNNFRYKYNSQQLDDTGLMYFKARFYDPAVGRFITADPTIPNMFSSQSFNRYMFVSGSPVNFMDEGGYKEIPANTEAVVQIMYCGGGGPPEKSPPAGDPPPSKKPPGGKIAADFSNGGNKSSGNSKGKDNDYTKLNNAFSGSAPVEYVSVPASVASYSSSYNNRVQNAKALTNGLLIQSSPVRQSRDGFPEWAYTDDLENLYISLITTNDVELLNQIGNAYIASVYGVKTNNSLYKITKKGKIQQLPRHANPIPNKEWNDNRYITTNSFKSFFGGRYIDNVHFLDDTIGRIHWDPNNPMGSLKEKFEHLDHDYFRNIP